MQFDNEYFEDDEFKELLEEYEAAVQSGGTVFMDADDLVDIAEYYQYNGLYEQSQQAIELAYRQDSQSISVLNYLIHEALANEDIEKARQLLDQMIDRQSPEYVYCHAEILMAQDKADEADDFLRTVLSDVPPDEYQDFVLDVANIYSDYGLSEKAMEWMMRAKPDNTEDFQELMARTLFGLGKYDDSERIFNQLLDRNPFEKRYWNALSNAQYMKEDYRAAVSSSEYAIAIDPDDPDALMSKANGLFRLDNFQDALKYYERYSEKVPDDELSFLHQGVCLVNLNRSEDAIERLTKAAALCLPDSPCLPEIYQELAFAYCESNQPKTALHYIDKTDTLDCDHIDMYVVRGHILLSCDRVSEAEKMFKKAIKLSGTSPHTLLRIIVSIYDNRYLEPAYTMFRKFFAVTDEAWDEGYAYYALCCWDLKRYPEFLEQLKTACHRNPHEARTVLSHLFPDNLQPEEYYQYMHDKLRL